VATDQLGASEADGPPASIESLLGIDSVAELTEALINRSMLDDGRFEAQAFDRDEHSTASAGALLIGLAGTAEVSDNALSPVVLTAAALIRSNGSVRGHDHDHRVGSTSWAASQLLLGLATRPWLLQPYFRIKELAQYVISFQDPESGGWPFRFSETASSLFAFYPTLALARVYRAGLVTGRDVEKSLGQLVRFYRRQLDSRELLDDERILALTALEILLRSASRPVPAGFLAKHRAAIIDSCYDPTSHQLRVYDRTVVTDEQPMWHATIWSPLLYLCIRRWVQPYEPVAALLIDRLIDSFDAQQLAWRGPRRTDRTPGVSWATALGLRTASALVYDLNRYSLTVADLTRRIATLKGTYDYDVVISFGRLDRAVAREIFDRLKHAGMRVFYDRDAQHELLGEDLTIVLQRIYFARSRYAVAVLSRSFVASPWAANLEWRAILARMQSQKHGYLLPYFVEDIPVEGLNPTIGYLRAPECSVAEFCDVVIRKLNSGTPS
jgi:hypothetical protein